MQFRYNFLQLLNPSRVVEPYVTVGFESVEYLTKTDLRDAQGRTYHYWSDGTIRDIDEQALNAGDAVLIQRDHTYESDVRESNLDGLGSTSSALGLSRWALVREWTSDTDSTSAWGPPCTSPSPTLWMVSPRKRERP